MPIRPISLLLAVAGFFAAVPARPADAASSDVSSIHNIVAAAYDVISGPASQPRDWARFRSLFRPDGRLISISPVPDGSVRMNVMAVGDFEARASASYSKNPFYEKGVSEKVDRFGHIAHVFSVYESRRDPNGAPFARGINSFQLIYDGTRWWIESLLWQAENAQEKVPAQYLKR